MRKLENMLLRKQLIALKRRVKRPALTRHDRTLSVLLASKLLTRRTALVIAQPSVLDRYRDLSRWVWRRKSKPTIVRGRPPVDRRNRGTDQEDALPSSDGRREPIRGAEHIRRERLKLG